MARTSRDPFSPVVVPMKKKRTVKKAVVGAVAPAALGIRARKKNTASASDLLSNLDDESPRKSPPEDMPSLVPYSKRNPPRSTRAAAPQPPTLVYLPLLTQPPDDDDSNPLDHNSPHKEFHQICRGVSHQTTDCWYQEKNKHRRPMTWTMEQVAIEEAMIESADPIPIWGGQRWQGSVDVDEEGCEGSVDVDEEGWEEDVEKGTNEGTEGTAD